MNQKMLLPGFYFGWNLKVFFRPKWNQKLHMKTWSRRIEKLYCYRDFELYLDDKLVAIATSKWIAVYRNTGKIARLTKEVSEDYNSTDISVFKEEVSFELNVPETFSNQYIYTSERRDIDTNHHVNNLFYLDFAYSSLPEEVYQNRFNLNNIEIAYKKEIKLGDTIKCNYAFENNKHIVIINSEDEQTVHAIIYLY